jgi:ATP-dependent helicase/nuclease subunit A
MPENQLNIKIISAGAGSGKTYSLTGEMVKLLQSGVRASGIIATTFTKKAAAELQERVRVRLLEAGLFEQANELGTAMIGTVNGLGLRLLQRFAFDAGVSPLVETMADEDAQMMFNQSLSQVLSTERIEQMNSLAERLGLMQKSFSSETYDWRKDILNITNLARSNDFSIEILKESQIKSGQTLLRFFQNEEDAEPIPADFDWNMSLKNRIRETIIALETNEKDETKTTKDVITELRNFQNQLNWRSELHWHEWVKIGKMTPATKSRDAYEELKNFAFSHVQNPAFIADIQLFTDILFSTAIDALQEFADYKRKRGLIDYIDMEVLVNRLLDLPTVQNTLRDELDLLLVDEFQDTSPIQLSIFLKMSRLARHSIWVGDPKQSIYGFRGAEPALMKAIVEKSGGIRPENILKHSWRSVPDLVNASNAIFTRAFADLPAEQVALEAKRDAVSQKSRGDAPPQKPLVHWHFLVENADSKRAPSKSWVENATATQLATWLERRPQILAKGENESRSARAGDVAILCKSNFDCVSVAEALHRAGLQAAISRAGLLDTTEAKLMLACLKFTLNSHDALAIAEILSLAEGHSLEEIIRNRLEFLEKLENQDVDEVDAAFSGKKTTVRWSVENQFIQKINELRNKVSELSSAELLDILLDQLDLRRIIASWSNPTQRLDNVDVMRKLAVKYEENCHRLHTGASLGGFLLWLDALGQKEADQQGSGESPDTVRVMTYHKSKGLEFPIVLCYGLEAGLRETIWGANLVSENAEIDLDNILGNRWLRFWINPYGQQLKGTLLQEAIENSAEFTQAQINARAEEARLLYVGITRARDFLIFSTSQKSTLWLNRVFHQGIEDRPTLESESQETSFEWNGVFLEKSNETRYFAKEFGEKEAAEMPFAFSEKPTGAANFRQFKLEPTAEMSAGWSPNLGNSDFWGSPILWKKTPDLPEKAMQVLHEFFLADRLDFSENKRLLMAENLLKLHELRDVLAAEMLLAQADSWWSFLPFFDEKNNLSRAVPLRFLENNRVFEGRADFIFEQKNEIFIFQFGGWTDGTRLSKFKINELAAPLFFLKRALEKEHPTMKIRTFGLFAADGFSLELEV